MAAAIARANGHDRLTKLYFPMGEIDEKYAESLKMASKALGPQMTQVLSETRPKYHLEIQHVAAVKKVSNDGKHWKLVISTASAHAVAWNVPGSGQWIKQIPDDAFTGDNTFEFYRGNEPFNRDMYFVFKLEIEGLSATLPSGPEIILECALRYVEAVVAAVSAVEF